MFLNVNLINCLSLDVYNYESDAKCLFFFLSPLHEMTKLKTTK